MALHSKALGTLISGDMVLPRISTNVMVIDSGVAFFGSSNPMQPVAGLPTACRRSPAEKPPPQSPSQGHASLHRPQKAVLTFHDIRVRLSLLILQRQGLGWLCSRRFKNNMALSLIS
jgi:hypothetical protein